MVKNKIRQLGWGYIMHSLECYFKDSGVSSRNHYCNRRYSGGRDQEDHGLKPAWGYSSWDPISKKTFTKKGWWSGSRYRPWVQTPVPQKKKKKKEKILNLNQQVWEMYFILFFVWRDFYCIIPFFFSSFILSFLHLPTCVHIVCATSPLPQHRKFF
jgi:hypothetical protein